jgi:hypothetical protein
MPFSQLGDEEVCPTCARDGESRFRRIKEYLYDHPGASATELVQALGVTMRQIQHYLREDRLSVVGDGYSGLTCDLCGKSIKSGRYCEHCEKDAAAMKKQALRKSALQDLQDMKSQGASGRAGGIREGSSEEKGGKGTSGGRGGLRFRGDDKGPGGRRR